ncbi:hypothetical protein [Alicyclobacillus suci]|uniref:hypothetical protein n=2 Tax=Alicyclobacillus suci TaxID=2816080 RepID=UPI001A8D376A|nr:hypothetical protein [Alicyclobacillus suci]
MRVEVTGMAGFISFLRTLVVSFVIAAIMVLLLRAETFFRSRPFTQAPTPPYVSVLTQMPSQSTAPWRVWVADVLSAIRLGDGWA